MQERIQKILARYGVASRRRAEQMIQEGRVQVNGRTCLLGESADPEKDLVTVDGTALSALPRPVYIMLHKPRGYVTTADDDRGRKTVLDLVDCGERIYPVGRLDMDSEGLLLLTNDGELTNRLIHPAHEVTKTYLVWLKNADPEKIRFMGRPMEIDGYRIRPAQIKILRREMNGIQIEIEIHEGRNRQIRKMAEQCGMEVTRLKRTAEGPVQLGGLRCGSWRHLTDQEITALKKL
ncbi:MAG: rRNA pseudouridine synthase [Oscillospiraceae bacterium]|nr:rRNA pseudouridine synthase [Oscillospiraceae bacterium]